jgi:FkbM family methyltransferase
MKCIDRILSTTCRWVGKDRMKAFIYWLARLANVDLQVLSWQQLGIGKFETYDESGEKPFVEKFLPKLLTGSKPVLFDVGANKGTFSLLLSGQFPEAPVYAFEPVAKTYRQLCAQCSGHNIHPQHTGMSSEAGSTEIHFASDNTLNSLASIYADVPETLHQQIKDIQKETITLDTVDDFCSQHDIEKIDFLKIDTEGHEYCVLLGAKNMLKEKKIGIILFEFNEMNTVSRVFLRDFYQLLPDYTFYRLDSQRLIKLFGYHRKNEIFMFQNIVAIPNNMTSDISSLHFFY